MPDSYPLSDAQLAMVTDSLRRASSGLWNVQLQLTMREELDVARFQEAWQRVLHRHTALRTRIRLSDRRSAPEQVVDADVSLPLEQLDWSDRQLAQIEQDIEATRQNSLLTDLDLSVAPAMRLILIKARSDLFYCIWVGHHSMVDGRSMYNLAYEVGTHYQANIAESRQPEAGQGKAPDTTSGSGKPVRPYADFIAWHHGLRATSDAGYWRTLLAGVTNPTSLGWPPDAEQPGHLGADAIRLGRELTAGLTELCAARGVSVNAVVQGAWALLLHRYSGDDNVVFGSTRAGRRGSIDGAAEMIGQFAHAVPVCTSYCPHTSAIDFMGEIQRQHLAVRPHEHDSPLAIRAATDLPAGTRLFESVVTFERASMPAAFRSLGDEWPGWEVLDRGRNGYAVTLFAYDEPELLLRLEWHGAWLDDGVAGRALRNLARLLETVLEAPDQPLGSLRCLDEHERGQLIEGWNRTGTDLDAGATLIELFHQQCARTPDRPAVRFEHESISFEQLSTRARRLAAALRARSIGRGDFVGVCLERSVELVVSLLAVLEAGAAYLPIAPDDPPDRIRFTLEDSGAAALIADTAAAARLGPSLAPIVAPTDGPPPGAARAPGERGQRGEADDLEAAYLIYTSGSTGEPKGVVNTHRGIVSHLRWMRDAYDLRAGDRVLQKTPFTFDVSVWEFFLPLCFGAELVIARPGGHRDPGYLRDVILEHGITALHFVPSMLGEFLKEPGVAECRSLKWVICSGEVLPIDLHDLFLETFEARLDNLYGPTEAAIDVTHWRCRKEASASTVPIGRPVANTRLYVLNERRQLTPIGLPGELYIGGVQVALGYLNRPRLTEERFVPDPFLDDGSRLYRTGDIVKYRPDGVLEFLGRSDAQVKIHGFRIELEEVDRALRKHPSIRDAAVVATNADDGGHRRLIAVVVFEGDDAVTTSEVRRFLRRWLPTSMIPGLVLEADELPHLSNGKIDRRALRGLARAATRPPRTEHADLTPTENVVASVWRSVLRVAEVRPTDNFFELGGNSLQATHAAVAIGAEIGQSVDPRVMFFQTLEQIAEIVGSA